MATVLEDYRIAVHAHRPGARCRIVVEDGRRCFQIVDGVDRLSDPEVSPTVAWREAGAVLAREAR